MHSQYATIPIIHLELIRVSWSEVDELRLSGPTLSLCMGNRCPGGKELAKAPSQLEWKSRLESRLPSAGCPLYVALPGISQNALCTKAPHKYCDHLLAGDSTEAALGLIQVFLYFLGVGEMRLMANSSLFSASHLFF